MTQSEYLSMESEIEANLEWLAVCYQFTGLDSCQRAGEEITRLLNTGWQVEQSIQTGNIAIIIFFRELNVETRE